MNKNAMGKVWETWVAEQLRVRGHSVTHLSSKDHSHCDLLVDGILIEVKSATPRRIPRQAHSYFVLHSVWKYNKVFNQLYPNFDFLVAVLVLEQPKAFIIPAIFTTRTMGFCWPTSDKSKRDMRPFYEAWHLITETVR